jgi:hypothetical protein
MDVYSNSRGKARGPTATLAVFAVGLALLAVGWAVGLVPSTAVDEGMPAQRSSLKLLTEPGLEGEPQAGVASTPLSAAPENVIADCNRFAGEVLAANTPATPDVAAGPANEGKETEGAAASDAAPYGLKAEQAGSAVARSAYRGCMAEQGFTD